MGEAAALRTIPRADQDDASDRAGDGDAVRSIAAAGATSAKERVAAETALGPTELDVQVNMQCAAVDTLTAAFSKSIDKLATDLSDLRTTIVKTGEDTKAAFMNNLQITKDAIAIGRRLEAEIVDLRARQAKLVGTSSS